MPPLTARSSGATSLASALATVRAISLCTAKMSSSTRSNICDQRLKPVVPSTRSAVTRTTLPARRTLPSSRNATPSAAAMVTASSCRSRNFEAEACAMTCRLRLRASVARSSSDRPSEK